MSPDRIFVLSNGLAACGWILLAVAPRRIRSLEFVAGTAIPLVFAILYVGIVVSVFGSASGGFSSLEGVATLFSNPWLLLAGWVHYLAFDLLIGNWEVRDARERGIPHLLVLPCLALTFLFGPAGWLLYSILRRVAGRRKDLTPQHGE